jgi:hypothetical protein
MGEIRGQRPAALNGQLFNLTLLHELIHARNDLVTKRHQFSDHEDYVNAEAVMTFYHRSEVLKFAREMFKIRFSGGRRNGKGQNQDD